MAVASALSSEKSLSLNLKVLYLQIVKLIVGLIVNKVLYYKGINKVKVVTESAGYLIVEALEGFDDFVNGEKVKVAAGEKRIVPINTLYKRKVMPKVKEHTYELKMERKLKRLVEKEERKKKRQN